METKQRITRFAASVSPDRHDTEADARFDIANGIPGLTRESSGWDVYNNEARKVDVELVRDWAGSLNFLLLFAAIFSAILTSFIIESKKLLQQDPNDIMADVMIFYTNNMANGTHTPYNRPEFKADSFAVIINSLFFASLSASLVAALASVIALQWVAEYDAAITRGGSSPEDRAKRRQYRYAGVVNWKMVEIVAALPLLLYCSVFLFFSGLIFWMWNLHSTVGLVVMVGAATGLLFYIISTALAVAFASAPFQTPLSRLIYSLLHLPLNLVHQWAKLLQLSTIPPWLEKKHLAYKLSHKRQDRSVERAPQLKMEAIVWLANRVSLSRDSYRRLMLLVGELPTIRPEDLSSTKFRHAPWWSILDLLGWNYLKTVQERTIDSEEMTEFEVLVQSFSIESVRQIVNPVSEYATAPLYAEYWSQYQEKVDDTWEVVSSPKRPNSIFLLLRDIPIPTHGATHELESAAQLARWRNADSQNPQVWAEIFDPSKIYSHAFLASCIKCFSQSVGAQRWYIGDHDSRLLYIPICRQIVQIMGENIRDIPPDVLRSLSRAYECLVTGFTVGDWVLEWLYNPIDYGKRLQQMSSQNQVLHQDYLLFLARTISSSPIAETPRRVMEVLMMIWFTPSIPVYRDWDAIKSKSDRSWIDKETAMEWILYADQIPHILEILRHLAEAQTTSEAVGPLWRDKTTSETGDPHLLEAFQAFDRLISNSCTPAEHHAMIKLICQELELHKAGIPQDYFTKDRLRAFAQIKDPCLRVLADCAKGINQAQLLVPNEESVASLSDSWARVGQFLLQNHASNTPPSVLRLQASLWHLGAGTKEVCTRALKEPDVLCHLQRLFEYPVKCSRHHDGAGHLLHYLLEQVPAVMLYDGMVVLDDVPANLTSFYDVNRLLAVLFLHKKHEKFLRTHLLQAGSEECLGRILDMLYMITSSRHLSLQLLLNSSRDLYRPDRLYLEDVAIVLLCTAHALLLPPDDESIPMIRTLALSMRYPDNKISYDSSRLPLRRAVLQRAVKTSEALMSILAGRMVFGRKNGQILSCARASKEYMPAIGWLAPHVD